MMLIRWPLILLRFLAQSAALALGQIWANKARGALTTVGIIIGVASVTTVIAVLTGLKQNVLSEFEAFGTNKIYIVPHRPNEGPLRHAPWHVIRFTPEQFDDLKKHCPSVDVLTRVAMLEETVQFEGRSVENVRVFGIDPTWHKVENRPITACSRRCVSGLNAF